MLTTAPGDQRLQQFLDIDAVGLDAAGAAINLQAGRIHHPAVDAMLLE